VEQVRPATTDDLDRLVELVTDYLADRSGRRGADLTRPSDGGGVPPEPAGASVAAYISGEARTALVGTLDDWVAAVALCRVDEAAGERRGVLDVCFVEPGAREVGLGHLLL
jgi:hypothetical protein